MSEKNDDVEIAPAFTVKDWKELRGKLNPKKPDPQKWKEAVDVFEKRITARFLDPAKHLIAASTSQCDSHQTFGFAILALDFLVIETLQGFKCGIDDHTGASAKLFKGFLNEWTEFKSLTKDAVKKDPASQLYGSGRCAVLHSGATDSIRVGVEGKMIQLSDENKIVSINRNLFHENLVTEFKKVLENLRDDSEKNQKLRTNFLKKMDYICRPDPKK